ncbi:type II secretion system F family protein [Arthrobacter sp. ISL-5]|uniref:type II secretion system F family protein n=1 Tax=Arthrobacter sp. ISL-5 TaxID=2819111 RepID=UPI001BE6ECD9|nr:type II secretion system F family protein [Arthrobacter sp. ISL-5]MBT2552943.1 type II secretion system F family protein [Arthrobacter sp. ISL-5]
MNATSPLFLAFGVGLCFAALTIGLLLVLRPGSAIPLSRRRPEAVDKKSLLTQVTNSAVSFIDRGVGKNAKFGTQDSLEQAGLRLKQGDFILAVTCAAVTVGLVGFILGGIILGLLLLAFTPVAASLWLAFLTARRRAKFASQLGETLQMLAGGLRAGHSLLRSVDAVAQEAEAPTSEEFARIVTETRLGRDLRDSMADAALRLKSEDFDWTSQAIEIHREVGGDLADVLDHVGETIRERAEIKGQVQALSAEGRLSAYILIALPVGMFIYLSFASPSYIGTLYGSLLGWGMIASAVIELAVGAFWLSRVVKIKF